MQVLTGMPDPRTVAMELALQFARDKKPACNVENVRVRMKPQLGLFATDSKLASGTQFLMQQCKIVLVERKLLTTNGMSAYHISDDIHLVLQKPLVVLKSKLKPVTTVTCDFVSCIRVLTDKDDCNDANAKMDFAHFSCVVGGAASATEKILRVPRITLTCAVNAYQEIVCARDKSLFSFSEEINTKKTKQAPSGMLVPAPLR